MQKWKKGELRFGNQWQILLLEACVAVVFWGKDGVLSVTRIFERNSINLFIFERNSINLFINICYLLSVTRIFERNSINLFIFERNSINLFINICYLLLEFSNVIQSIFSSLKRLIETMFGVPFWCTSQVYITGVPHGCTTKFRSTAYQSVYRLLPTLGQNKHIYIWI